MKKSSQKSSKKSSNLSNHSHIEPCALVKVVRLYLPFCFLQSVLLTLLLLPPPLLFAKHQDACLSHSDATTIIDDTYDYINNTFCQPAIWFDDFFVDERIVGDAYAGTMMRWYNDISWGEGGKINYQTKLRARVHLPHMTKKLKLVFESDVEESIIHLFPNNTTEPQSSLGLNYDWVTKEHQNLSFKVTIKPSIEGRYRYIHPLTEHLLSRFTVKLYQRKKITGSGALLDFDYSINDNFLLRWANVTLIETENLLELGTGLTLYQYISATQALNYRSSVTAQEKPYHYISNYHLSISYRQNILRKWFYYEIRPEINWFKEATTDRHSEAIMTLRLEVLFDNI